MSYISFDCFVIIYWYLVMIPPLKQTLCSLCMERMCGKKSSTGGIRQLLLQWL